MNKDALNIVYTVDDNYLPLVSISLASIQENNRNKTINVYIATNLDDNTDNFKKIVKHHSSSKLKIYFLNCRKYDSIFNTHNMNRWGSDSYYIYWRLVAFSLLNVDYAIYVDSDVLCLKEISFQELENKPVGCVLDSVHACYNAYLNVDNDFPLYNTGTMFVDVNKWQENKCTEKCLNYIKNVNSKFMMADQDLFSLALKDDIKTVEPKYNWFAGYDYYGIDKSFKLYDLNKKYFYSKEELKNSSNEVMFYHCLDGVFQRPWVKGNIHPAKDIFNKYKSLSAWPEFETIKDRNNLFKIELFMEKLLPEWLYCKIHNAAIKRYIKNEVKNINE